MKLILLFSVVSSIVANPPEASFFADVQLEYFTSISSEIEALCSPPTMKVASSNSPVSSLISQNNYSRNTSMESASSIDPSASFNRTGFRQRNPSSSSSSGACFETEGHLTTQDSLSSIVQEQSFVPGRLSIANILPCSLILSILLYINCISYLWAKIQEQHFLFTF